jgi:restriction system protein
MGAAIVGQMWRSLAYWGQFIVPAACVFAAIISAVSRHQRKGLTAQVAQSNSHDALEGMSWQQFEMLVGEAFRLQGYAVQETGGSGPDGGIDLVLHKEREKFLVQCKQWKAYKVSVQVVRELFGLMAAHGAAGGFVVTSGRFTEEATAFASGRNLTLVDGPKLFGMIQKAKASRANRQTSELRDRPTAAEPAARPAAAAGGTPAHEAPHPACPVCSREMVLRKARRGPNAGGSFWGCTGFPGCRGIRQM